MSGYRDIELEIDDPVAIIRLNRPEKLNAFTPGTLLELRSAIDKATNDARVVGIIITGNGKGFCSGLDSQSLVDVTSGKTKSSKPVSGEIPGLFTYFLHVPKPIVTAINGVAAGGGMVMTLMSDIRIASTEASFVTVFLKRGLIAEHGSSWLLPRLVGTGKALDLLWMSDRISGQQAYDIGLVERLVEAEDLLPEARSYIEKLSVTSAPAAIAESKRLVYSHWGVTYPEALTEAHVAQELFVTSADAAEGARALIEKRAPKFKRLGET